MKRAFALIPLLIPIAVWAQTPDSEAGPWAGLLSNLKPRSLGPTNMGGRVTDLAVFEKSPRIFYIASASGGLWKTENAGLTVAPVFDRESSVSLGACAVSQRDPNVVWVGTGEATSRNSVAWGDGVYKSTDGGKTWTHMGLRETMHVSRIVIDPRDDNVVYVGAAGRVWGTNPERGVYKTTDGGKTWQKVLFVDDMSGVADLQMDPKNPNNLLCAMWTRIRKAYDFTSGGPGSALYKSTDGGKSWKKVTKGLPEGPIGRIGISYFRQDPKIVVATVEFRAKENTPPTGTSYDLPDPDMDRDGDGDGHNPRLRPQGGGQGQQGGQGGQGRGNRGGGQGAPGGQGNQGRRDPMTYGGGTFRSTDGGESWTKVNDLNPRPFYFSRPQQDPQDVNRIYVCAVSLHVSDDLGKTFRAMRANIHPDNHAFWVDPNDNNYMIIGNDGGVSVSRDRGVNWAHLNNLPIGQFYGIAFDFRKPYWVYGGLQDNGSWGMPTQTDRGGPSWWNVLGVGEGDGFHAQVDPTDWRWLYTESQGGAANRFDLKTGLRRSIRPRMEGERLRFNWSTPIYISPNAPNTIYIGSNRLFKSINRGDTWKAISPDLSTNDPAKLAPGKNSVTPENTGAEAHCTIITIAESPRTEGELWAGTDDGKLWMSPNGGGNWVDVGQNIVGLPANTWCSRVIASKWADGRAYATFDGHRNNDFKPYVYVTEDSGKTWKALTNGLPDYDCVYVIREGDKNPDLLYLGSEKSLRMSFDHGQTWSRFRTEFPTVAVHDVQVHPRDNDLVIGTHGRSIWILDVSPLEQLTAEKLKDDVFVAKPQSVYVMTRFSPTSQAWDGDGVYFSQNTQPGTNICYYLKGAATGDVGVSITDAAGTATRDLTGSGKAGLNVVRWDGRIRGRIVDAGDYRVVVTVNGKEYVTSVHVEDVGQE